MSVEEDTNTAIVTLAAVRLQSESQLFQAACCPDKDLVVLVSKSSGTDERLSLWKLQGSKKWEVELARTTVAGGDTAPPEAEDVTALTWSPDGQVIVVGHHPSRVTLHTLQNGREERSLAIETSSPVLSAPTPRITGLWWFKRELQEDKNKMPDIFKRGDIITGSALSLLRMQPLLDPLQEDVLSLSATDLFVFQGTQNKQAKTKTSTVPEVISSWPALPSDPLVASIKPSSHEGGLRPGEELDEKDMSTVNSLLTVTDDAGRIHCFLDGSYPLGAVHLGNAGEVTSLAKKRDSSELLVHAKLRNKDRAAQPLSTLVPLSISLPRLYQKETRNVADVSSAARELTLYATRVVKEMRQAWFGGDGQEGARAINVTYVRGVEERQRMQGQETNAVFDLTVLLAAGKPSPALIDFHATSDLTAERGLQKWDSTVSEALLKLRDYSEKRVAPACQRLHLLLEEVRGWSLLPRLYGHFDIRTEEVDACLDLAARGIILSAWLAATARSELSRFTEFIKFLSYETTRGEGAAPPIPRFDILKVSEYLTSGLVVSTVDRWFLGPVPAFRPESLGPTTLSDLRQAVEDARQFAADSSKLTWPPVTEKVDLKHLDRNLDALVSALAKNCQKVFERAAKAVSRTATCSVLPPFPDPSTGSAWMNALSTSQLLVRMQVTCEEKGDELVQYTAVRVQSGELEKVCGGSILCLIQSACKHAVGSWAASGVAVAVIACTEEIGSTEGGGDEPQEFDILDMDFFDEESLAIVYRAGEQAEVRLGLMDHRGLEYRAMFAAGEVSAVKSDELWIEAVVYRAIEAMTAGQLEKKAMPIRKGRGLKVTAKRGRRVGEGTEQAGRPRPDGLSEAEPEEGGPGTGAAALTASRPQRQTMLAVNGRAGRRVACVLGEEGKEVEMLDMEGDGDEEAEEAEEAAE